MIDLRIVRIRNYGELRQTIDCIAEPHGTHGLDPFEVNTHTDPVEAPGFKAVPDPNSVRDRVIRHRVLLDKFKPVTHIENGFRVQVKVTPVFLCTNIAETR